MVGDFLVHHSTTNNAVLQCWTTEYSTAFKKPQTDSLGIMRASLVISSCYMKQGPLTISDMYTKKRFLLIESWCPFNKIRVLKRSPKGAIVSVCFFKKMKQISLTRAISFAVGGS